MEAKHSNFVAADCMENTKRNGARISGIHEFHKIGKARVSSRSRKRLARLSSSGCFKTMLHQYARPMERVVCRSEVRKRCNKSSLQTRTSAPKYTRTDRKSVGHADSQRLQPTPTERSPEAS